MEEKYVLLNKSDNTLYINTKVEDKYIPVFTSKPKAIKYINRNLVNCIPIKIKIDTL